MIFKRRIILFFLVGIFFSSYVKAEEISIFIAGDTIINRSWSHYEEPEFLALIKEIQTADFAICNLETLIHTYKGFPQIKSGGTYMAADPHIANELAWAGFTMVGCANNHTFNYGSIGIIETTGFIESAGIKIAGVGDLQRARSPVYDYHNGSKIALLAATSTFDDFQKASKSNSYVHGRVGCNPLSIKNLCDKQKDVKEILQCIREAKQNADCVVFSMHAHSQGKWLQDFAHKAIDAGVDIFLISGPHSIKPIEIYKGKPIFYSLGNFVFQSETVKKLPAEYVEKKGYDINISAEDFQRKTRNSWNNNRIFWEGLVAKVYYKHNRITKIHLFPTNLGVGDPGTQGTFLGFGFRGRPMLANKQLGKYLINKVNCLSGQYRTRIVYDEIDNIGVIVP